MSKLPVIAANEIEPKRKRRRFTDAYKRKIVAGDGFRPQSFRDRSRPR